MIADPLSSGAVHDTVTSRSPTTVDVITGASGFAIGMTGPDVAGSLGSTAFFATTVKLYAVPLSRPTTGHDNEAGKGGSTVQVEVTVEEPTGVAVTV